MPASLRWLLAHDPRQIEYPVAGDPARVHDQAHPDLSVSGQRLLRVRRRHQSANAAIVLPAPDGRACIRLNFRGGEVRGPALGDDVDVDVDVDE